jgi:hypothetical protein
MKNTNNTKSNLFPDKMEVNLNVFSPLMLDWVGRHVDGANVVAINQCSTLQRGLQFAEKLTQPGSFCNSVGNGAILRFGTGPGHSVLAFGGPGNEVITKEDRIARSGLASIWAASPVSIRVGNQLML